MSRDTSHSASCTCAYLAETEPERKEEVHEYLDEGERALVAGNQNPAARDTAQSEALAVLLGGGEEELRRGLPEAAGHSASVRPRNTSSVSAPPASASASRTGVPCPSSWNT